MSRVYVIAMFLSFIVHVVMAQIEPEIVWTFETQSAAYGMSAAADLNGDGYLDVVFGCYRNDGKIYALSGKDGSTLWSYDATVPGSNQGCNDVAVLIYDIDEDGLLEVIVPSSCYNRTFCFNGADGTLRWSSETRGSDSPPVIADLSGDGRLEIIHGEFQGWVRSIDALTCETNWDFQVQGNCWIQTAPTLVDVDKDGSLDFVVATWSFSQGDDHVYAFKGSDRSMIWKKNVSRVVYHGSAIGDIDGDGDEEMLFGCYNDTLYCLNVHTGETKWTYTAGVNFVPGGPIIIADVDGDGRCEVIGSAWFRHFVLDAEGQEKWTYNDPRLGYCFRGPAVADINGDEYPDLVFGTSMGMLRALDGNTGHEIFSLDLRSEYGDQRFGLDNAPLIADFDNDGHLEVFIVGGYGVIPIEENFGRAYMIKVGQGHGPEWLMFQHDIHRRSNLCVDISSGTIVQTANEYILYPNPAQGVLYLDGLEDALPYQIVNLFGHVVNHGIVYPQQGIAIDLLPVGYYIFSIYSHQRQISLRFLKI